MNATTLASTPQQQLIDQASATCGSSWSARILGTQAGWAPLVQRVLLAGVMFPHGAQKVLGWFGGYGFSGTLGFLTEKVGLPSFLAVLVIAIEFLAPILLLLGLGTRLAAAGIAAVMLGAIATVHAPNGFFMNWSGSQAGEGFEYHLLAIGLALSLVVSGAGRASIDRKLSCA